MGKKLIVFLFFTLQSLLLLADGISVDAGLTPAQDRWIIKSQMRFLNLNNNEMHSSFFNAPLIFAYGLLPNVTIMYRQNYISKNQSGINEKMSGLMDPFLLVKMKLFRKNTEKFTFGIAPSFGVSFPVMNSKVSMNRWNPELGINSSFRPLYWSFDLNIKSIFRNFPNNKPEILKRTDELNLAVSRQFYFHQESNVAFVPVIEYGIFRDIQNTSSSTFQQVIACGLQVIMPKIIFEGLFQNYFQNQNSGNPTFSKKQLILGVRFLL